MIQAKHILWICAITVFFISVTYGNPITLDFDSDSDGAAIDAGQVIDDEFSSMGLTIGASNHRGGHPDTAIAFDSANPTGGDSDLATPGSGSGNNMSLGMLLIIAENDNDQNNDGLVDNPDDEAAGGTFSFRFDFVQTTSGSATLVDIEESGGRIELYNDGSLADSVSIGAAGNNSVQTVDFGLSTFDEIRMVLTGSGAVGSLELSSPTVIPEPASIALLGAAGLMMLPRGWRVRRHA